MVNFMGTILGIILIIVVLKIAMKHKDYWETLISTPMTLFISHLMMTISYLYSQR